MFMASLPFDPRPCDSSRERRLLFHEAPRPPEAQPEIQPLAEWKEANEAAEQGSAERERQAERDTRQKRDRVDSAGKAFENDMLENIPADLRAQFKREFDGIANPQLKRRMAVVLASTGATYEDKRDLIRLATKLSPLSQSDYNAVRRAATSAEGPDRMPPALQGHLRVLGVTGLDLRNMHQMPFFLQQEAQDLTQGVTERSIADGKAMIEGVSDKEIPQEMRDFYASLLAGADARTQAQLHLLISRIGDLPAEAQRAIFAIAKVPESAPVVLRDHAGQAALIRARMPELGPASLALIRRFPDDGTSTLLPEPDRTNARSSTADARTPWEAGNAAYVQKMHARTRHAPAVAPQPQDDLNVNFSVERHQEVEQTEREYEGTEKDMDAEYKRRDGIVAEVNKAIGQESIQGNRRIGQAILSHDTLMMTVNSERAGVVVKRSLEARGLSFDADGPFSFRLRMVDPSHYRSAEAFKAFIDSFEEMPQSLVRKKAAPSAPDHPTQAAPVIKAKSEPDPTVRAPSAPQSRVAVQRDASNQQPVPRTPPQEPTRERRVDRASTSNSSAGETVRMSSAEPMPPPMPQFSRVDYRRNAKPHEILRVPKGATFEQARAAYRKAEELFRSEAAAGNPLAEHNFDAARKAFAFFRKKFNRKK